MVIDQLVNVAFLLAGLGILFWGLGVFFRGLSEFARIDGDGRSFFKHKK